MKAKDVKFKIEVCFSKNRHYDKYGTAIETHSIYIPYGNGFEFKSSSNAISFVKSRIDCKALDNFDSVCVIKWHGCCGVSEYLKESRMEGDSNPIDKDFAEKLLSF